MVSRFVDESIPWLIANGKIKEAERIIQKAARVSGKTIPVPVFDPAPETKELTSIQLTAKTKSMTSTQKEEQVMLEKDLLAKDQNGADDIIANDVIIVDDATAADGGVGGDDPQYQIWDIFRHRAMVCYTAILGFTWRVNIYSFCCLVLLSETTYMYTIYIGSRRVDTGKNAQNLQILAVFGMIILKYQTNCKIVPGLLMALATEPLRLR